MAKTSKTKTSKAKPPLETVVLSDKEIKKAQERMLKCGDGTIGRTINHMIQSRFKILYVRTYEERRVVEFFKNLATYRGMELFHWDCDRGLVNAANKAQIQSSESEVHDNPAAVLSHIIDHATKQSIKIKNSQKQNGCIYLLLDFHIFLDEERGLIPQVERKLKEFSEIVSVCTLVIVAPLFVCPPTLDKEVTLIDFPIPSHNEIKEALHTIVKEISIKLPHAAKQAENNEEDLIKAVSGLTVNEAENAYAMSVVRDKGFKVETILEEKKQMIRKGGILDYRDPRFTLEQIGGLNTLKEWVTMRRMAFKEDARDFGLPSPKGLLLLGIPGTGKSMACEAIAHSYQMPLLRLDFGAVFSAHVGESENNMRECLRTAEAIAPCIFGDSQIYVRFPLSDYKSVEQLSIDRLWNISRLFVSFPSRFPETHRPRFTATNNEEQISFAHPLQILGYDLNTESSKWIDLYALVKRRVSRRLRISTDEGVIEVSEDHQILVDNNGVSIWKKARDLQENDSIINVNNDNIQAVVAKDNANDRKVQKKHCEIV